MDKGDFEKLNQQLITKFTEKFGERVLKNENPALEVNSNPEYPNQFFRRNLFTNEIQCNHACHHFNGLNPDKTWFSQGEHPNTTAMNEIWGDNLKRQDQALKFFNCVYLKEFPYQGEENDYFDHLSQNIGTFDIMKENKSLISSCEEQVYGKQHKTNQQTAVQCILKCQVVDKIKSLKQKK